MPQMMPMKWIMLMNLTIIFLISTISFLYFFHLPYPIKKSLNYSIFNPQNEIMWTWKW